MKAQTESLHNEPDILTQDIDLTEEQIKADMRFKLPPRLPIGSIPLLPAKVLGLELVFLHESL